MNRFINGASVVHAATQGEAGRLDSSQDRGGGLPPGKRESRELPQCFTTSPCLPSPAISGQSSCSPLPGQVQEESSGSHEDIRDELRRNLGSLLLYDMVLSFCLRSLKNNRPVE